MRSWGLGGLMSSERNEVGKTADVGYQIGVSRTLPFSEEAIWGLLLSPEGQATWLGGPITVEEGARYSLADGASYYFIVESYDAAGLVSPPSNEVSSGILASPLSITCPA